MSVQSYADEGVEIYDYLRNRFASATLGHPNTALDPSGLDAYVDIRIRTQRAFNAAIGSTKRVRHPGLLTLVVRTRANRGDGTAIDLADELADVFRNKRVADSIQFRAPTVRSFGTQDGWHEVHVDCPYYRNSVF